MYGYHGGVVLRCMDTMVVSLGFSANNERRRLPVILVANKIDLVRRRIISLEGQPTFSAVFFLIRFGQIDSAVIR